MRTENIKVTFKIPIPVDKPNLNSMVYSKEAIKNIQNIPIEVLNNDGQFLPIGIAQKVELIEDENSVYITGIGLIWECDKQIRVQAINELIAKCESAKFADDDETVLSDIHQGVNSGLSMAIHFAKELKRGE
jgi:hypothetical protein